MAYPMHQPDPRDWAVITARLRRCARGLTGSAEEAADLTQQTLATLLARRPEMADHAGYARTTMFRLWLDRQRSLRRRLARLAHLFGDRSAPFDGDGVIIDLPKMSTRTVSSHVALDYGRLTALAVVDGFEPGAVIVIAARVRKISR